MKRLFVLLVVGLIISGCATLRSTRVLQKVSLGLSKQETIEKIGRPKIVRGILRNKYGETVEVWEYRLDKGKSDAQRGIEGGLIISSMGLMSPLLLLRGDVQNYWLYFVDDELVRWEPAGDWEKEANRIYDIRFKTNGKSTQ